MRGDKKQTRKTKIEGLIATRLAIAGVWIIAEGDIRDQLIGEWLAFHLMRKDGAVSKGVRMIRARYFDLLRVSIRPGIISRFTSEDSREHPHKQFERAHFLREMIRGVSLVFQRSILRAFAASIAICAWFGLSNHCLLTAAPRPLAPEKSEGCPMHAQKQLPKPSHSTDLPCCKTLAATPVLVITHAAKNCFAVGQVEFCDDRSLIFPGVHLTAGVVLDTGPPPTASTFAELVLQRSIFAHAPPILA